MNDQSLKAKIAEIDQSIRLGNISTAAEALSQIKLRGLARELRLPLARLLRRCGKPFESLRLLHPVCNELSASELAEYALVLAKVGGVEEAMVRLRESPESDLELTKTLGLCAMSMWDYAVAEKCLSDYLRQNDGDTYQNLVLRVNRAACSVFLERHEQSEEELDFLIEALKGQNNRLLANCYELKAQTLIQRDQLSEAKGLLELAQAQLPSAATNDVLFLRKWEAYLEALSKKDVAPLLAFKKTALKFKHWESARDADRLSLNVQFDEKRFRFLYFGTPHVSYRSYLLTKFKRRRDEFDFFTRGNTGDRSLSLSTGELDGQPALKVGQSVHRMLTALLADFYRPPSIASLHWNVFPTQYFNPTSSPLKVHQTLHRLRAWISDEGLPIYINENDGNLSVMVDRGVSVEIPTEISVENSERLRGAQLVRVLTHGLALSARNLADRLNWSHAKVQRTLKWALEAGLVQREGQGRETKYKAIKYGQAS